MQRAMFIHFKTTLLDLSGDFFALMGQVGVWESFFSNGFAIWMLILAPTATSKIIKEHCTFEVL